jgi:phosphoenolpyruvate carboxykinase (ATP)
MPILHRNLNRDELTKWAVKLEFDTTVTDRGALSVNSYHKKGRSPNDKRIVASYSVKDEVDWGKVNMPLTEEAFEKLRERAKSYLDRQERLFIVDCFAGQDKQHRIKVRVITTRAYHAMFMMNMLIEPTPEELASFGEPDYTIYNAGECCADRTIPGVTSETCVALNFRTREQVILGTQYAGEMKKGILTVMMYVETKRGNLVMHASANESESGEVTVFFGLSGTGKTTLSADPARALIGDDEHVWTHNGIFNVEGGCYAKAIGLTEETEPDIYRAVRGGAVAENVVLDPKSKAINYNDITLTENTRVAYPLGYIKGAKLPAVGGHPKNVIFLTNDAYGVMPPVARLTPSQAKFWFVTGYTAKVPGTEVGVQEPQPTFSACFAGPFLVMHPTVYADLLEQKMKEHNANVWLVNTGWSGGKFGKGKRMKLSITRAIITAINNGSLARAEFEEMPGWGLQIPKSCPGVEASVLNPINTWPNKDEYVQTINKLAGMFRKNFEKYASKASGDVKAAAPQEYRLAPKNSKL